MGIEGAWATSNARLRTRLPVCMKFSVSRPARLNGGWSDRAFTRPNCSKSE